MLEDGFISLMLFFEDNVDIEKNLDSLDPIESSDNLDNSGDHAEKSDSENIPNISDLGNWYTLRVVSGKEKFVKEKKYMLYVLERK